MLAIQNARLGLARKKMSLGSESQNGRKILKHRMGRMPADRKQGLMGIRGEPGCEAAQIHIRVGGKLKASAQGKPKPQGTRQPTQASKPLFLCMTQRAGRASFHLDRGPSV